jgi:hypothetical protein
MSTKQETKTNVLTSGSQSIQYDPASFQAYKGLQPLVANLLKEYMKDPLQATYFNQLIQQSNQQAGRLGQSMNQNLFQNQLAGGFSGNAQNAMQQSILASNQRAVSAFKQGSFTNSLLYAQQARERARRDAQSFRPLQTGTKTSSVQSGSGTTTTSGLGTWLPQVAGAAIGAAANYATGGASGAVGGGFTGTGQMTSNPASWPGGFGGQPAPPYPGFRG